MKCNKCGNELKKDDNFCSSCGTAIEDEQKRRMQFYESSDVTEAASVCRKHGNSMTGLYVVIAVLVMTVFALVIVLLMNAAESSDRRGKDTESSAGRESDDIKTEERADEPDQKTDKDKTFEALDDENEDENEDEELTEVDWQTLYLDYLTTINKVGDDGRYIGGGLLYVDDDDIPELYLEGDCEATGCLVLTCGGGKIDELQTARLYFTYIEKKNLLNNCEGHMGYYYDNIYTIRNGIWENVARGEYSEDYEAFEKRNFEGEPDYIYKWDEKEVTEEEYKEKLLAVYDSSKAKDVEELSFLELESLIKTGKSSSAEHRYELIVDDVTWTEAERTCRQMGGYLATLTTREEFEKVSAQIEAEGKTGISFFVGATRDSSYNTVSPDKFTGYFWVNDSVLTDYCSGNFAYWLSGEPSYTGLDADGNEVDEMYVDMVYRKSDGRCYLNDVADNILKEAPGFAGKIGYICEYE